MVKNSLSERAADKAGAADLKPMLVGPTALTFVQGDAALAAKALNDAARRSNLLEFKGGLLNGSVLSADDVRSIARLPSREVLQAQLVGTIAAPLTGLVRGLNALIAGIAIQLQAIVDHGPARAGQRVRRRRRRLLRRSRRLLLSRKLLLSPRRLLSLRRRSRKRLLRPSRKRLLRPRRRSRERLLRPSRKRLLRPSPRRRLSPSRRPLRPSPKRREPEAAAEPEAAPAAEPEAPPAPTEPEPTLETETQAVSDAASSDDKEEA